MNLKSAYLTTGQAAQQLGISRRTLGRAVDRGEIAWDRQTPGGWALLLTTDVAAFAQRLSTQRTVARQRSAPAASRRAEEAHAALRQSADVLRALGEHVTDLVSVIGAEGTLLYTSPAYERVLGYAPQEVVGQRILTIIHPDDRARVQELLTALRQTQGPLSTALCLRHRDGSWRRMEVTAANHLTDPVIGGIIATMRDITVRTQAEEALRASEERYRGLVETSPDAIALLDLQGVIQMANQQAALLYHYPEPQALIGCPALELLVPADRARAAAALAAAAVGAVQGNHIYTAQCQDGATFTLELRSSRLRAQGGRAQDSIMIVARDVTERTQAAERLQFQAHLLETVGQAIIATDGAGVVTYWNQAATALYGWTSDEALNRSITALMPPTRSSAQAAHTMEALAQGANLSGEWLVPHRDGSLFPALVTTTAIHDDQGALTGMIGVSSDISARVQAEERLTVERDLLRTLMDAVPDALYIKDSASRYLRVNAAQARALGATTPQEMVGKTDFDYYPPALARQFVGGERRVLTTGEPLINDLVDHSPLGQGTRWILSSKAPTRWGDQITGLVGISRDITTLKQAEEERERFFTLSLDLLCVAGLDGYFTSVNPAFEQTLGFTPQELCAEPFLSFVHPDDQATTLAEVATLATGVTTLSFENRYRCKDGTYRWLLWTAVPVPAEGLLYATARDITERKAMEQRQQQHIARISALHAIDTAIAASVDLRVTLGVVLEQVCTQLGGVSPNPRKFRHLLVGQMGCYFRPFDAPSHA